jgi:hypothetical protein
MTSSTGPAYAVDRTHASSDQISARRRNVIFVAIVLGMLVMALGQTSVAPVLSRIVRDIGDAAHQSWGRPAYLLGGTGAISLVGKLGDLVGRKAVLQAGQRRTRPGDEFPDCLASTAP